MLKTFDLRGRERPLTIYGPPGLRGAARRHAPGVGEGRPTRSRSRSSTRTRRSRSTATRSRRSRSSTACARTATRSPRTTGPGASTPRPPRALGVTPGPDFGRLQAGETVDGVTPEQVLGEPRRGRRIVYSGDTAPCQATEVFAHEADLLVHEATFLDDELARARETGH